MLIYSNATILTTQSFDCYTMSRIMLFLPLENSMASDSLSVLEPGLLFGLESASFEVKALTFSALIEISCFNMEGELEKGWKALT